MTPAGSHSAPFISACYICTPHCFDRQSKTPHSSFLSGACSEIRLELFLTCFSCITTSKLNSCPPQPNLDLLFPPQVPLQHEHCCDERGVGWWGGGVVRINNGELGSAVLVLYATFTYRNTPLSRRYLQDSLHAANCSVWRSHSQCTEVHRRGHHWLPVHLAWTLTNCGRHEAFYRLSQRLVVLNQHDNSWSRYQPNNSTTTLYNTVLAWIRESGE